MRHMRRIIELKYLVVRVCTSISEFLEAARTQDFERFVEYVYAVLPSWGMHQIGRRAEDA